MCPPCYAFCRFWCTSRISLADSMPPRARGIYAPVACCVSELHQEAPRMHHLACEVHSDVHAARSPKDTFLRACPRHSSAPWCVLDGAVHVLQARNLIILPPRLCERSRFFHIEPSLLCPLVKSPQNVSSQRHSKNQIAAVPKCSS